MKDARYAEMLEQAVIGQIGSDLRNEDHSALSELFTAIPTEALEAYLSDWRLEELTRQYENGKKEIDFSLR